MLLAGIIESDNKTTNLIYNMLSSKSRKVKVSNYKNLLDWDKEIIDNYLKEISKEGTDIFLIKIDTKTEQIISKDIILDFIVCGDKDSQCRYNETGDSEKTIAEVFGLLDKKGIAIVNVDNTELLRLLKGMKFNTITYGFNSKASMTTSSTGDGAFKDSFICCLQRTLPTKEGMRVEPQEYKIKLSTNEYEYDAYSVLAAATFAVVNDIDLNHLQ